jgi:hypothetical protein
MESGGKDLKRQGDRMGEGGGRARERERERESASDHQSRLAVIVKDSKQPAKNNDKQ